MGVFSGVVLLGAYALLLLTFFTLRNESTVTYMLWPHRVVGFVLFLFTLALVDSYVVKIPSPFAPAEISLPAHSRPPPAVEPLHLEAPSKTGPSAKDEHSKMLKEWSTQ